MAICTFVLQMTTHHTLSDLELIDQLKQDDEDAFNEIYRRYAETLVGFASSKLYNLDDSRDIIHDIFVKVWKERNHLQVNFNLKAYRFVNNIMTFIIKSALIKSMTITFFS